MEVTFITEILTGGSLRDYVKKIQKPILKVIKGWCIGILEGLSYLHGLKPHPVIHRDIKCDNVFINSNSGEIKIGDLGLAAAEDRGKTLVGTPEFMAPELYEESYDTAVDIWSFGMLVLELATGKLPYSSCEAPM